jgi:hypothetical protein
LGISYQRFRALSYLEETYLTSCNIRLGTIMFQPVVRIGTVRYDGEWVDGAALVDMVLRARIMPELRLSIGVANPFGATLIKGGETCPTSLTIGVGYRLTRGLALGAEIEKIVGHGTCVATGAEVRVGRHILLRSGVRTEPEELSLGLGLCIRALVVDVATTLNMDLGFTYHVGATFVWR